MKVEEPPTCNNGLSPVLSKLHASTTKLNSNFSKMGLQQVFNTKLYCPAKLYTQIHMDLICPSKFQSTILLQLSHEKGSGAYFRVKGHILSFAYQKLFFLNFSGTFQSQQKLFQIIRVTFTVSNNFDK